MIIWSVTADIRVMTTGRWTGDRCTYVMKHIETGRCHLSGGYIFALRVIADLPHNRVLLSSAALFLY